VRHTNFSGQEVRLFQLFAGEGTCTIVVDIFEDETMFIDVAQLDRDGSILREACPLYYHRTFLHCSKKGFEHNNFLGLTILQDHILK